MELEAGVLCQPGLHVGRLVGGVIIENQMNISPRGHGLIDLAQEFQELIGAMPRHGTRRLTSSHLGNIWRKGPDEGTS